MARTQLENLRAWMSEHGVDAVLVVTDDFHGSEYVGDYFRARAWLTGFTGSAGTAVVTAAEACLWTDGRYFLQAAEQLENSGFALMKSGEPDVPSPAEWLLSHLQEGQTLAFDGRTVCASFAEKLVAELERRGVRVRAELDPVGEIWTDRPALSAQPAWQFDVTYAGKSREDKLAELRAELDKAEADCLVLTSLDDIMWLLNIRGGDVAYNPVLLCYLYIDCGQCWLFTQPEAFCEMDRMALQAAGITLAPYDEIYDIMPSLTDLTIWLDPNKINYALVSRLPTSAKRLERPSPTELGKAVKNATEISHAKKAHVVDGVAVTRFIYWLKHRAEGATERSAADVLEQFRQAGDNYRGPSFEPIIAYGAHGAIVHYSATEETDVPLEREGFVLCDTGGHYLDGSTDVTRTVSLGALTQQQQEDYTDVLRGHLNLAAAIFREGMTGTQLDILARQPLWQRGLNYNHGTGHGVGHLLSIHEGPNAIRWRGASSAMLPGMITSDEPGLYREGAYGIRIENLLLCCKTATPGFLCFEHLTPVPYDRAAILPDRMTAAERALLNAYHEWVYAVVSPSLPPEEEAWLREETAAL